MQAQDAAETAWDLLRNQSSKVLDMLAPVVRHLAAAPGTRILLMVSPGFVTDGMDRQLGGLADVCLRAHIVVNALDDEGLLSGGRDRPNRSARKAVPESPGPNARWRRGPRPSPGFSPTPPPPPVAGSSTTATTCPVVCGLSPPLPRFPTCSASLHPQSPTANITSSK